MKEILEPFNRKNELVLEAGYLESGWIENKGNGKFVFHILPTEAQLSPIFGIVSTDINTDGYTDIILNGNDYGAATLAGRSDAFNGLVLAGSKNWTFRPLSIFESGFYVPGNGKRLVQVKYGNQPGLLATQNNGPLKLFRVRSGK